MSIESAFLGPQADELFYSVAACADARALDALDVPGEQEAARRAIDAAIGSALRRTNNPGTRIALIKGDAGSGKTHVLTTTLKRGASMPTSEVYPAVLQLTAPVQRENYESWLLDATIRELSARYFGGDGNQSPLRRLAGRLLERMPVTDQDEYLRLVEDLEDDGEIPLALKFGRRLHKEAGALLEELPPPAGFIACVLLAGFGDSSALNYLRSGVIDGRIESLGLEKVTRADERIGVLRSLGLTAQIVGACLALAFDQVENSVRLGDEGLFVHTLTQAVRIAESIHNAAVIVVVLGVEYEDVVGGNRLVAGLPPSDRDRIERERPQPVHLGGGSPAFFRKVVARRIALLRQRAKLAAAADSLAPLPEWFLPRIDQARNVRIALSEVAKFRERAIELGRIPSAGEFPDTEPNESIRRDERDFDKEWQDFQDSVPVMGSRLPEATKADLLAWWAADASREGVATAPAAVEKTTLHEPMWTPVIDIRIKAADGTVAYRRLAVCEAANRNHQLAEQVEQFLAACDGAVPAILRTNGFPKGRQSQVAGALRKLEARSGLKLDLGDTEWHVLRRARDFVDRLGEPDGFLAWRRDRQWLSQLVPPLQVLIAPPLPAGGKPPGGPGGGNGGGSGENDPPGTDHPFPVHIGASFEGSSVVWDPYRESPDNLNNFSMLITGDAGSGKTQTIRVLIDAACREGLAVTLFDFKADYCDPGFAGPLGIDVIDVRMHGLPFNPLQPPPGGASGAQPIEHAHGISGVLARVFSLGPVQEGTLRDAIAQTYQESAINPREWMDPADIAWPSFDLVLEHLRGQRQNAALLTKLAQLCDLGLFRPDATQSFASLMDRRVCLKLSGLPTDEVKSAIAEIIIIQLHGHALRGAQPRRLTRLMVFDEAHRVKDSQRLETLAREGRAFGVGIVIGTQFPGDIPEAMAGNLATQLFLMNSQVAHRRFVANQLLGSAAGEKGHAILEKLGRLRPLQGVYANAHYAGGVFVKVLPHHQRADVRQ